MPKCHSPAAEKNRDPILSVLRRILPARGTVLSVASGSGQHDVYFAEALPHLTFQPSDLDDDALASIAIRRAEAGLPNVAKPIKLDASRDPWPIDSADAVININMIHIAPWRACEGLFRGAARILERDAVLYLYGPMFVEGREPAPSNVDFDRGLRAQNPEWGVRTIGEVERVAWSFGFRLEEMVPMPANNTSAIFRRTIQRLFTFA
jgi:hypothetical protein